MAVGRLYQDTTGAVALRPTAATEAWPVGSTVTLTGTIADRLVSAPADH
jgi:hypothetical protein